MTITHSKSGGFTLIELVMVIVILGVLAATALPKFVDLTTEANTAATAYKLGAAQVDTSVKAACNNIPGVASATCDGQ